MWAFPLLLLGGTIAKIYLRAAKPAIGVGGDVISYQTTLGRPHRRRLEEAFACSDVDEEEIQTILMTLDFYGPDSGVSCRCLSSSDNIVSCDIPREDECKEYNCNSGWECTNSSDATVTVCATVTEAQHWEITPASGWSREKVVDSRYFYSGVSNLHSRTVETDRTTEPASCGAFYVDGEACTSCERCIDEDEPSKFMVVANCTNLIEGAVTTCEEGGFLKRLLVLDSNATGAPTPSPTPYPTSSPTKMPTPKPTASSTNGRAMLAAGSVISAVAASFALLK